MSEPPEDDEPSDASPVEGSAGDADDDAAPQGDDSTPAPGDGSPPPPEDDSPPPAPEDGAQFGTDDRHDPNDSRDHPRASDEPVGQEPTPRPGGRRAGNPDGRPASERGGRGDHPRETGRTEPPSPEPNGGGANPRAGADVDTGTETRSSRNANARQPPGTERRDAPAPRHANEETADDNWAWTFLVDVGSSALAVLLVGFFLFTVSGVWPPMVAVESASMTPNMQTGDLVFVMEEDRFPDGAAQGDTGVVTAREGAETGYSTFDEPGDVIVFEPDGNDQQTPIIHRAMFWVEEGERWYDKADKSAVGSASSCEELTNCPAPTAGFITKGDANPTYDQVGANPHSDPVKPEWVVGTAEVRVPKLGCIRLPAERCGDVLVTSLLGDDLGAVAALDPERLEDTAADLLNATA